MQTWRGRFSTPRYLEKSPRKALTPVARFHESASHSCWTTEESLQLCTHSQLNQFFQSAFKSAPSAATIGLNPYLVARLPDRPCTHDNVSESCQCLLYPLCFQLRHLYHPRPHLGPVFHQRPLAFFARCTPAGVFPRTNPLR